MCSPSDKPPESIGMVNGETLKQVKDLSQIEGILF